VSQQKRDGAVRTSGLQWLPLADLRERFIKKHGSQEWQLANETEWTVNEERRAKSEDLYTCATDGESTKSPA